MTLEHYPGMTENAIKKIVEEARAQWEIMDYTVIHRYGDLQPNDQIVLVAIASSHVGNVLSSVRVTGSPRAGGSLVSRRPAAL